MKQLLQLLLSCLLLINVSVVLSNCGVPNKTDNSTIDLKKPVSATEGNNVEPCRPYTDEVLLKFYSGTHSSPTTDSLFRGRVRDTLSMGFPCKNMDVLRDFEKWANEKGYRSKVRYDREYGEDTTNIISINAKLNEGTFEEFRIIARSIVGQKRKLGIKECGTISIRLKPLSSEN